MPVYGKEVDLTLDDIALLSIEAHESKSQTIAVKTWYRVNQKKLDPTYLQP